VANLGRWVQAVDQAISHNTGRVTTAEVLAGLDGHDERILAFLRSDRSTRPAGESKDPDPLEPAHAA